MSKIRGEYWIQDGQVDFADGDVGDMGHEAIATNHFANKHIDEIINLAESLGVDLSNRYGRFVRNEEYPVSDTIDIRNKIVEAVENQQIEWELPEGVDATDSVNEYLQNSLNVDDDEYACIFGDGDARTLVMEKEGWIAVRSNNVEVYGFDNQKRGYLLKGIDDILEQEGIDDPDENIELSIEDKKTRRSWSTTLEELRNPVGFRPVTLPQTTYNKPLWIPPDKTKPMGSQSPKSIDARTRGSIQTSESTKGFKSWLKENCEPFIVRRSWPFLSGGGEAPLDRPVSRRGRRGRRR